jgi:hypothetical protein
LPKDVSLPNGASLVTDPKKRETGVTSPSIEKQAAEKQKPLKIK